MTCGTPNHDFLERLERRRDGVLAAAETMLMEARSAGREELNEGERQRLMHAKRDLSALDERIAEYRGELERAQMPAHLSRLSHPTQN